MDLSRSGPETDSNMRTWREVKNIERLERWGVNEDTLFLCGTQFQIIEMIFGYRKGVRKMQIIKAASLIKSFMCIFSCLEITIQMNK